MTDDNPPSQAQNPTPPLPPAGWYRDPMGQGDARYWNGAAWTDAVSRGGVTIQVAVPPDQLRVPPVPGSEYHAPVPPPQPRPSQPAPQYAAPPPEPRQPERRSGGTSMLVGLAVAAAAILVVVLVVVAVFDDDGDDPEPSTTTVPTDVTDPPAPTEAPADDTSGG